MSQQAQPPSLVYYSSESEYKNHFCRVYCNPNNPIYTFNGIRVDFVPDQFDHVFYEGIPGVKGKFFFSDKRAERIDWIKWALQNQNAALFQGWDSKKKCHYPDRRVCVVEIDYIVIIHMKPVQQEASFITAFLADTPRSLQQIMSSPKWVP